MGTIKTYLASIGRNIEKGTFDMIPKNTLQFFIQHFFTNNTFLIFTSLIVLVLMISRFGH